VPLLARISEPRTGSARAATRRTLSLTVPALSSSGTEPALIHNLSEHGLRIETDARLQVDEVIRVELPGAGGVDARVIWTADDFAGCRFLKPVSRGSVSAALLRSPAQGPVAEAPFRVELPMIDVVDRPVELERAVSEPGPPQPSPLLLPALVAGTIVAAMFVGFLLLMAIAGG